MKRCSKCHITKEVIEFCKNSRAKDGLQFSCKVCQKEFRIKNKDKIRIASKEYAANNKDKIKAYNEANKDKIAARGALYREKNKEKIKEYFKEYNKNNRDKINERARRYKKSSNYKEYRKRYRLKNRDSLREWHSSYRLKNSHKYASYTGKRRAMKKDATPKWAELDKIEVLYEKCSWLSELTGLTYSVDHVIPINSNIVCGLHVWANLQILEVTENSSKGNKVIC